MPVADSGGVKGGKGGGKKDKDDDKPKGGGGKVPTGPGGGKGGGGKGGGGKGGGGSTGGTGTTPGGGSTGGGTKDQDPPVTDSGGGNGGGGNGGGGDGKNGPGGTKAISDSYKDQALNLQGQANALLDALKNEISKARDSQLADIDELMRQQDNMLMEGFRARYKMLEGASLDNEISQSSGSSAAAGNMLRERNAALAEVANQGGGESDALQTQLMSLRNWQANQTEVSRSYFDTLRSINSSLTDLNVDTKTARINNEIQANADKEQLWTNFYNQQSELWTQLGNTYGQQADYLAQADAYGNGNVKNGGNGNGGGQGGDGKGGDGKGGDGKGDADWGPQPGSDTSVLGNVPKNWTTGQPEKPLGDKAAAKLLGNAQAGGINKTDKRQDLKGWLKESSDLSAKERNQVVRGEADKKLLRQLEKQTGVDPKKPDPPKTGGPDGGNGGGGNGGGGNGGGGNGGGGNGGGGNGGGGNGFGNGDLKPDNTKEAAGLAADAFGKAADSLGKDWDNPGISKDLRNWEGKDPFAVTNNNFSRLASAQTIKKMKAPEGASLRRW